MFGLDGISCRALQKYYYQRYGTTLRGLMSEYGIDPAAFLDFAHDIDRSSLAPHPALSAAIGALPGRKLIMTNGSVRHAERTIEQLGIAAHFDGIFDIVAADFDPKPNEAAYRRFFDRPHVDPAHSAMFEDLVKNLAVPYAAGMTTVLVVPDDPAADPRESWEKQRPAEGHVDWVTADLAGFLHARGPEKPAEPR
jgi:putative hydrolase of the HAD superfamily